MGQYCCTDESLKKDMENNQKAKNEMIQTLKKPNDKDSQKQRLLPKNQHNYEASPTPSSVSNLSLNSTDINTNEDEYEPPNVDTETLLKDFEESIIAKDFQNAMALYEEYWNVDFKNHEFKNGDKALHYAIRQRNSKFAYFMLQKGADPNVISRVTGDTPLHIATRNEDVRMITLLMKWNADVNIINGADKSPYDIAVEKNNPDIIEMFDATFQSFLQERGPTLHNYSKRKGIKAVIGKHTGAQKNIKSAWDFNDGGHSEAKIDANTHKKKRKIWAPKANDETNEETNEATTEVVNKTKHKPKFTATESEFEDDIDDESEQKGSKQINAKVMKMLGATKQTIENENDVSDILQKLNTEELNSNNNNNNNNNGVNAFDFRNEVSDQISTDLSGTDMDNEMSVADQENLIEMSFGGSNSNIIDNRTPVSSMRSKMKKLKSKSSRRVLTALGSINKSKAQLPKLGAWLEKRRNKPPTFYQKRFLCVVDGHLLWNEKRIKVNPNASMDSTERKKFSGSLSLMLVKDVYIHESKKPDTWKFDVIAHDTKGGNKGKKERIYVWKTKSRESRDNWVNGIKKHCEHLNNTLNHFNDL